MHFRILGPLAVEDGEPFTLGPPKQRAVLVELLRERRAVTRERLIDFLWGDDPPKSAVNSLQVYVHGLRRVLGEERIETVGAAYRLRVEEDELDLDRFMRLVDRARSALTRGAAAHAADDLASALGLWRGPALADLAAEGDVATYARELEERRLEALELRNDAWLALGRHDLVLQEIDRLLAEEPFRERLQAQRIVALYRDGRQADALAAYRETRRAWNELGLEPTRALQDLERAVLRHDPELQPPAAAAAGPSLLPAPPTPLVGRRLEVAAVAALLRSQARLVTLVGPGGAGKTRIALAVAEELADEWPDGAAFVDLSAIHDPQLLLPTIAQGLELPVDAPALADVLASHLADRSVLLVLDNLEQLAAGVRPIGGLLTAAPRLRVLATSRAPLRLAAEHEYHVRPLPVPRDDAPAEEIGASEAVQLFLARARAAAQELEPGREVAALCRRLDGLPLALELAAARTKLLMPAEILDRLEHDTALLASQARDVPERQSTLAATIEWSLALLEPDERRAFARLGVFLGGCTVDAAARLGVDLSSLSALVDHSLVQRRGSDGRPRLTMLETVRAYAVTMVDDDARREHAEWLTELAETVEAEMTQPGDSGKRLDELEAELDNVRAALDWALRADAIELALRLISASRPLWEIRGHLREGSAWVDEVLRAAGARRPDLRAKALGFAGTAAFRFGDLETAAARWREMLALYEELDDADGRARGLSDLGTVAAAAGDWAESAQLLEQAAEAFRSLGERKRLAVVLANLGHVAGHGGDLDAATAFTLEALELQRELGDDQRTSVSLNNLGSYACDAGAYDEARRWLDECDELAERLGYREVAAHALVTRARIAFLEGAFAEAARFAAAADATFADLGVRMTGTEGNRFDELKREIDARLAQTG